MLIPIGFSATELKIPILMVNVRHLMQLKQSEIKTETNKPKQVYLNIFWGGEDVYFSNNKKSLFLSCKILLGTKIIIKRRCLRF